MRSELTVLDDDTRWSIDVRDHRSSGIRRFVTTHSNVIYSTFHLLSRRKDGVAGECAFPTVQPLRRSLSAQSSSTGWSLSCFTDWDCPAIQKVFCAAAKCLCLLTVTVFSLHAVLSYFEFLWLVVYKVLELDLLCTADIFWFVRLFRTYWVTTSNLLCAERHF